MNSSRTKENINHYLDNHVHGWARGIVEFLGNKKQVLELIDKIGEIAGEGNIPTINDIYQALHVNHGIWISNGIGTDNIPKQGSVILAADHYRGMIDGLIHAHFVSLTRPGKPVKFLTSGLAGLVDEMQGVSINVSDLTKSDTRRFDTEIEELLSQQGTLTMFPSGRSIVDIPWKKRFLRIAQEHKSTIIPASTFGTNPSKLFKLAHQISYYIDQKRGEDRRDAAVLNPGELLRQDGRYSAIYGKPITPENLNSYTPEDIKQEVRRLQDMII